MTKQSSFKRLVRARMDKTGESYTAARAQLLTSTVKPSAKSSRPSLATTDDKIRARTGRGWEEWFDLLDEWGAQTRDRIARSPAGSPSNWTSLRSPGTHRPLPTPTNEHGGCG